MAFCLISFDGLIWYSYRIIFSVHIREGEKSAGNSVMWHTDNANKHQYKKHLDSHGMTPGKYKSSDSYMIQGKYKNYINSHMISGKYYDFDADSHGSPGKPRRVSGLVQKRSNEMMFSK